jgi:hypothetical protein
MLQDMRYYIVTIHISSEVEHTFEYFVQDWPNLSLIAMLKHALDNSAPVLVHTHLKDAGLESFHYELDLFGVDLFNDLLDDMIPVGIFHALDYSRFDFRNYFILKGRRKDI